MVSTMTFQPLSFQEANPYLTAIQTGQQIRAQALKDQLAQIQNQFAQPMAQQELQKAQLANQGMSINNQYLPQSLQANIGLTNARIPLTNAQTNYTNTQATNLQNFPIQSGVAGQMTYLDYLGRTQGADSPSYQMAKQMLDAQMAEQVAKARYFGANTDLKNLPTAVKNQMIAEGYPIQSLAGGTPSSGAQTQPSASSGAATALSVPSLTNYSTPTVRDIASNAALKETTPAKIIDQRYYSQMLNGLMDQAQPLIPSVAKYAGAAGQAKLTKDKVAASLGTVDPDYSNFLTFTRTVVPPLANEMRRTLGGQATNEEKITMEKLADPTYWASNAPLAMRQFQTLRDTYKNVIDPVLAKSIDQITKGVSAPKSIKNLSDSNLEYTAKQHGMTVDQVKQRLGIQ